MCPHFYWDFVAVAVTVAVDDDDYDVNDENVVAAVAAVTPPQHWHEAEKLLRVA